MMDIKRAAVSRGFGPGGCAPSVDSWFELARETIADDSASGRQLSVEGAENGPFW